MSNPHDKAYELAKAIKNSEEGRGFSHCQKVVLENPETKALLEEFRAKQMELQMRQMQGEQLGEEEIGRFNELIARTQSVEELRQLLDAERRLSVLMADINRIVLEPMQEWFQPK
jgi:cell fate (sporulation/competence/biofilm development) regulator YlbF (YheA/YmcA/DUF963 family)